MANNKVNPPHMKAPLKLLQDPEFRNYFTQLDYFLYQLWQRTGGGDDFIGDSQNQKVVNVSVAYSDSPYTQVNDFERIFVNASSGNVSIALKSAANPDRYVDVIKIDSSANTVTATSSNNINGQTSQVLKYQYESMEAAPNGSEWVVI